MIDNAKVRALLERWEPGEDGDDDSIVLDVVLHLLDPLTTATPPAVERGARSHFCPAVTVEEDGAITIDWYDSWERSEWYDGIPLQGAGEIAVSQRHSDLLDVIAVQNDTPTTLRRLADYIDAHYADSDSGKRGIYVNELLRSWGLPGRIVGDTYVNSEEAD